MLFDVKDSTIRAYGEIGEHEISDTMFIEAFDEVGGDDVTIHLQSPGGDVIAGLSIYNQIQNYGGKVTVNVDSLSASIASVLMMAADVVNVTPVARVMVHRAWSIAIGNSREFYDMATLMEDFDRTIAKAYAKKTGGDPDRWFALMDKETWFNADEAVEAGLADGVIVPGEGKKAAKAIFEATPVAKIETNTLKSRSPKLQTAVLALRHKKRLLDEGLL